MRNLVFICVDCLRNDILKKDGLETPFLDSLSEESLYFSNMFSTTTTTTPSVTSFMTGCYSEKNGVRSLSSGKISNNIDTLAEKFKEKGFNTYAETTGPLVEETDLDRGFVHYNNRSHKKGLFSDWFNSLKQKINSFEEPYFFYLHLWELHKPIKVPEEFQDPSYGERDYEKSLCALDRKLEELTEILPGETTLVLHGDHGESITWRDNFFQNQIKRVRTLLRYKLGLNTRPLERRLNLIFNKDDINDHFIEDGHGENTFNFASNVPLYINSESLESVEKNHLVRQIDIFPTLLDLFEIQYDEVDGKSLLSPQEEDRIIYQRACGSSLKNKNNWIKSIRNENWKLITYPDRNWPDELYNLEKDPEEKRPVQNNKKRQN